MRSLHSHFSALLMTTLVIAASTINVHAKEVTPNSAAQHATISKPTKSGYVEANGIRYHYQVRGKGEPLLLLQAQ